MPAVVGIAIDKEALQQYGFTGSEILGMIDELFEQERQRYQKQSQPRWTEDGVTPTIADLAVVGSGFIASVGRHCADSISCS